VEQVLLGGWHLWGGGGEMDRKKVNMVQICVNMYVNTKMIPVETVPEIRGGSEFKYGIFDTL
jgi:hypothetical protein